MHGGARGGEERKRRRHMWPVPTAAPGSPSTPPAPATPLAAADTAVSLLPAPDCFLKDGRKIRVGDCALFQAGDAPPFIGIIRWFATSKEDYLKLCVNWLYRPADVKLAKGLLLDAAPNEIFYSFHKDVISAASLLHPCKVAFLRKGVDLPLGKSSFVCRRVYDIENKCLWWLTDQDYINERQEEVDHLLNKTRLEMHAAVQSGGRSPKQLNGSNSMQQLKSASDNVQISGTSFPSQVKGKKRERGDQVTEPIKRERSTKMEDADSGNLRLDGMIKAEIAKMTDKGGLTNSEGVDKLVHIMQLDRAERKLDLAGRVLLADVIAATDKNECLSRFVQLRGVPVLDEWLQEAHKGKSGDGSSPKESDKPVEELLFALLRALDKLPVSLNALQTCNIGKSVNHLRTHKNVEIQKKARSLVDTWKKRVDAEIKNNDAKSIGSSQAVPWPGKPGFSEVSHALHRRPGSADLTIKGCTAQPSTFRALPGKPGHGDAIVKSTPGTMGSLKLPSPLPASAAISSKEPLPKAAGGLMNLELPQTTAREEKSSSSSQSLNNSQSCSSDHAKTVGSSWKEDARSSTAGSMNASKTSSGSSRHRRSSNGFPMTSISGVQKETSLGKSVSLIRTTTSDKVPQGALTCERPLDVPVSDHGNSHRLIVRLPNPGRSPVQIAGGGSFEDPSVTVSRASSPSAVDKHEISDRRTRVKGDRSHIATDVNAESWLSNDSKEALAGHDRCDPSPVATLDDERRSGVQTEKSTDVSRATCPSSGNEKGDFVTDPKTRNSFSSMNALVESCVKYSEASAAISSGDDIGINLLASVAAGEMSKSNLASTTDSPGTMSAMEEPCAFSNDAKSGFSCDGGVAQKHCQSGENADINSEKQRKCAGHLSAKDESLEKGTVFSGDKKIIPLLQENKLAVEHTGQNPVSNINTDKPGDSFVKPDAKLEDESAVKSSVCIPAELKEERECDGVIPHQGNPKSTLQVTDNPTNDKLVVKTSPSNEKKSANSSDEKIPEGEKIAEGNAQNSDFMCNSLADGCRNDSIASGGKSEKPVVVEPPSCLPSDNEVPSGTALMEQQPTPVAEKEHAVDVDIRGVDAGASFTDKITCPESADLKADLKARNLDGSRVVHPVLIGSERKDQFNSARPKSDELTGPIVTPLTSTDGSEEVVETKEVPENHLSGFANENSSRTHPDQEAERCTKPAGSLLSGDKADTRDELASSAEVSSSVVAALPDSTTKLDFDLNEGIPGDDGHQNEAAPSAVLVCSPNVHLPRLSSFSSSPMSNGSPAPITVAAPAKGPFVHPENLSKHKAEPGWKGSAATSAFRPAEPRKVLEMPLSSAEIPSSHDAGKRGRPLLDIDLNVADERVEDMASPSSAQTTDSESGVISNRHAAVRPSGGLDLDLNIVGEGADNGQLLASTNCRLDQSILSVRPTSGRLPNGDANMFRNFDLNNGPGLDEVGVESLPRSQYTKGNPTVPFLPPVGGLRMNNPEFGSSWFPSGSSYPAVAIPSFLTDRGDHPYPIVAPAGQRILGSVSGAGTFSGDMYRGPVLSSSPAMAFSPATAFPYAGFPFGSNFPVSSTSFSGVSTTYVDTSSSGVGSFFPAIPSQFIGPAGGISAHYPRPYMSSLPEGSASGGSDSSRKWTRQGLDLNAGPGGADTEVKDDRISSSAPRQFSVAGSQAFLEEQARLYQAAMAGVRRKEPDGGWDADRFVGYKQHSWQ